MRPRLRDAAAWVLAGAAAVLPFQAVGPRRMVDLLALLPFDALLGVAAILAVPACWAERQRVFTRAPVIFAAALGLLAAVAELADPQPDLLHRIAEQLAIPVTVVVVATLASDPVHRRRILRAAVIGGAASLTVGAIGFTAQLAGLAEGFALRQSHPVFDGLPRFTGTFGSSPQRLGQYLVTWLAIVAASDLVRRRALLVAGAAALAATMSFAWVGGLLLLVPVAHRRSRRLGWAAALAVVALTAVASHRMMVGPEGSPRTADCAALDVEHFIARVDDGRCTSIVRDGRRVTAYAEALRASLEAIRERPLTGVGFQGFARHARRSFQRAYGGRGVHYAQPHGAYHGLLAKHGLGGLLALLLGGFLVLRTARGEWSSLHWGLAGLALIALHLDVDRLRHAWLLLGLVASAGLMRSIERGPPVG